MLQKLLDCKTPAECLQVLIVLVLLIAINMFILRFFWNSSLVKHVSVLKPISTLMDAFMLAIALTLLGCTR